MADVFISALPAASTPLDGTELVPIVQSGVTVQTTTGDLLYQETGSIDLFLSKTLDVTDATGAYIGVELLGDAAQRWVRIVSTSDNVTDIRLSVTGTGGQTHGQLNVIGSCQIAEKFAANGSTPQAKAVVNAAASDPATTQALVNQLRAALIANGICV